MTDLSVAFKELIVKHGITLEINPKEPRFDSVVSLDVEHNESGEFVGVGVYNLSNNTGYYFTDILDFSRRNLLPLSVIAHNGKTDLELLRFWGCNIKDEQLVWDTQLIAHIIDSSRKQYGLKKLALEDCHIEYPSYDDIVGKRTEKQTKERMTLDKQPLDVVAPYCVMDCFATAKLWEKQRIGVSDYA